VSLLESLCERHASALCALILMTSFVNRVAGGDSISPIRVQVVRQGDAWQLLYHGKPYFIKGAGGGGSNRLLAQCGGNSFRTWGVGPDTRRELDEARQLGLTVTVGHWLGHKEQGFNYNDAKAVQKQFDDVQRAVEKFKDHPALLMWALGNEMEVQDDSPALWQAIQDLAKMVHRIDPRHPTMTVIAELGKDKVAQIHKLCPDIDVIGINSYGGGPSLAQRYRKAGGVKPFVITEFGPPGTWEVQRNAFGAAPEKTSTEKAAFYRQTYRQSVLGAPDLCLGSYAFTWGYKIEATATWFGMLLPDGSRLAAADTIEELWTGKKPARPCPIIRQLRLDGKDQLAHGEQAKASVDAEDPSRRPLKIQWAFFQEQATYDAPGLGADPTSAFPEAIARNGRPEVVVAMPSSGGIYRLYCYVRNEYGGAAVGSLPIKVTGPRVLLKPATAKLPLVVYADGQKQIPYVASGWMGNTQAISMDEGCTDKPHSGKTCIKVTYGDASGWGGVVWQNPANDWGVRPGGFDLIGAEELSFWARGQSGGEKVKFGYGVLGIEKKYHDSSTSEMEVTLTSQWKQYKIDLDEKDLGRIKSGFFWSLSGQGKPVTFYLDDIIYR
jgi:hypothetical protein